jgi:hypothetical protein
MRGQSHPMTAVDRNRRVECPWGCSEAVYLIDVPGHRRPVELCTADGLAHRRHSRRRMHRPAIPASASA